MKNKVKKIFSIVAMSVTLGVACLCGYNCQAVNNPFKYLSQSSQSNNDSNNQPNFNFIKSGEKNCEFIYDGSIFLYGGLTLIATSAIGIICTICSGRNKKVKKRNKKGLAQRYKKWTAISQLGDDFYGDNC